ncbi:hypothetical protein ABBQ32_009429 [Trebouxia sp. C0010 RCD-2024]
MTGALPKWEAALDTFDRIKHNFRAPGQIEKALNSVALDERVLLFRGSDSDIVERLSPYDQMEGSGNSQKRKQEQQDTFRLQLYNYYFDKSARILPTKIQCMITRQSLQAADMVGAHLWPKSRDMEAFILNIPDVWHVRNGMLWAPPFEQAWNRKEVALFWDTKTSCLFVRVLTQELMTTPLMHYRTSEKDQGTYKFKQFGDFDRAEVLHVRQDAMPYRRALLYHAAVAVAFQRSRGMLRDDVVFNADDFDVVSDFEKKPDVQRWLSNTLPADLHPS